MARRSNLKGYCNKRHIEVSELNTCDLFDAKIKLAKAICRNCVFFTLNTEQPKKDKPENPTQNKE